MNTEKIGQLRADIATLRAAEEVAKRNFGADFHCFGWISTLEDELKSLENAAIPAEVVRADQLKAGDKVLCGTAIETVGEIDDSDGNEFQRTVILKDFRRRFCSNHELIARIVEAKPCD